MTCTNLIEAPLNLSEKTCVTLKTFFPQQFQGVLHDLLTEI